ncbi:hypothetical protein [Rhizobium leguminosarum]|uniref:hypothetical protein n=1 Tax=Rhizobium leguminosarum TaxID=384 RepID=UPI001441D214|nr:hypothetical protein [Rhizobium leguminosarum]MBY5866279.1 hypothetical protein [Rhizobium leguminosarum]NKM05397.1 hypothetical protein [Rhizobium leguminosarum bv. viciae]
MAFACRSARDRLPAIRRFALPRAGFQLQNLLSIHLDILPDVYPAISLRISVLLPLPGSADARPACQWSIFASLRDSALNSTNKPCLTENSDQENDMGATQRRQSQSRNSAA